jgi:hypothetical protein
MTQESEVLEEEEEEEEEEGTESNLIPKFIRNF